MQPRQYLVGRSVGRSPFSSDQPLNVRTAWALWGVFLAVMCGLVLFGNKKTVGPIYFAAGERWAAGEELYDGTGDHFIYLPQAAILCVPLQPLSLPAKEIFWRVFVIGVYVAGIWKLAETVRAIDGREFFGVISFVAIPLAWSAGRYGQSTLAIAGLAMLAASDLACQRWWRAVFWLTFGVAVKPLIIVQVLLAGALFRPMLSRLAVGLLILAALPFLTQSPAYVISQYTACGQMFEDVNKFGAHWADFFGMFRAFGTDVPRSAQMLTRLVAAAATLALCYRAVRMYTNDVSAMFLYALSACYLMLFNPRTENNTYAFVAPAIGLLFAQAIFVRRNYRSGLLLVAIAICTVGAYQLSRMLTPGREASWLAPLMCTIFSGYIIRLSFLENFGWSPDTAAAIPPARACLRPVYLSQSASSSQVMNS